MTKCGKDILIAREGTEQQQRFIAALSPDSLKLNDFSLKEWMKFAYGFAKHVNYFDVTDSKNAKGNWQDFFKSDARLEDFLKEIEESKNITPHLALFVSFLKLLEFTQERFNLLTKRHLDFYYGQILKIEKLPATPDKVHLIFELAKNAVNEKISKETELDGGKDANGKKLIYKTEEELIANKIAVSQFKSVYVDHSNNKIKAAEIANSYDGIGGDFPDDEPKWWPFGYYEKEPVDPEPDTREYDELQDAKLGFALSSEILELQEGQRNIQVTIEFTASLKSKVSAQTLQDNIEVYCSGEKEWIGPFDVLPSIKDENSLEIFSSGQGADLKTLPITFQIPKEKEAIVNYDAKVLGEFFDTKLPVCRLVLKTENASGIALYRNLAEQDIKTLSVDIYVKDVRNLLLESDIGVLNAAKPFYPFGTQPVKRSKFYIDYPELFKKKWIGLKVDIAWKNTPEKLEDSVYDAFKELYYAYRTNFLYQANSSDFMKAIFAYNTTTKKWQIKSTPTNLIVNGNDHFKANIEIQNKEEWEIAATDKQLFIEDGANFTSNFLITNTNSEVNKNGPVRISLNQSFLHELFPRIYALAFASEEKDALIPNEPYTPLIEEISLDYTAKSSITLGRTEDNYKENSLKLFHEQPFGQSEEHPYLKHQTGFLFPEIKPTEIIPTYLVPTYCKGGELYIALENVKKGQMVSLLVQVLEGTENPQADSFTGKQKVEWSVLSNNYWRTLNSNYITSNETDNFLKSGIVQISIPNEATSQNSYLPDGFVWIKAKIHKTYDAVCKIIDIHAQAITAEFFDNKNDLTHLENGLAADTISKLIQRVPGVKAVSQPYNSFGGKPLESDAAYYRRISERIRHKNRAITLWDYEHIILQQFPEIHKVKVLNHTRINIDSLSKKKSTSYLAPGNVLIVVVPDIVDKNVFDIYQPRVSTATLNAIQSHVNKLNTLHISAHLINPDYEEVKVELKVKFYKGYDDNYYTKVLKEDITKLLSPWAFDSTASISFGISLYKSVLINYVENLDYVDYVEGVELYKRLAGESDFVKQKIAAPSKPTAILVSAKDHDVKTDITSCKPITEVEEKCQK